MACAISLACAVHDLQLGASDVVLRQLADVVEQERAQLVVEPHRRQFLLLLLQAFEHIGGERVSGIRGDDVRMFFAITFLKEIRLRLQVARQAHTHELPASLRIKEVPVRRSHMIRGRNA